MSSNTELNSGNSFYSCNWCDEQIPHKSTTCIESPSGKHEDNLWINKTKEESFQEYGLHAGRQGVEDHSPVPRHPRPMEF